MAVDAEALKLVLRCSALAYHDLMDTPRSLPARPVSPTPFVLVTSAFSVYHRVRLTLPRLRSHQQTASFFFRFAYRLLFTELLISSHFRAYTHDTPRITGPHTVVLPVIFIY